MSHPTRSLARFLRSCRVEDIPEDVRHEAKRALLNYFAVALGGARDPAVGIAVRLASEFSGPRTARLVGRGERLDALNAAFVNAVGANVFDFDDTHHRTIIHPTAPVAPALFALAELRGATGRELLHAFVLGVEVECRIGNAVSPQHYRRGWHITSTCGVFGSAAAAGKLIGLDEDRLAWALGSASAMACGLVETLGSMAKSAGVGNAARNGLMAALLAEQGFTGPDAPLEGPRGFCRVTGDDPDFNAIEGNLGETWELRANTYKPYPCGVVLNAVIDATLALRPRLTHGHEGIVEVVVSGHPLLRERADRPDVTTGREAQVSAQHAVAAVLLHGTAGLQQFSDTCVRADATSALRRKVRVATEPDMPVGAARVMVALDDGCKFDAIVEHARGSRERPLPDRDIEAKLASLAAFGSPHVSIAPLVEAIWSLDQARDAASLMAVAAGGPT